MKQMSALWTAHDQQNIRCQTSDDGRWHMRKPMQKIPKKILLKFEEHAVPTI